MDPIWIGIIIIFALILLLVFAFLLFNNEQSFEDALAQQKASSEMLIESKSTVVKGVRQRKKPKKEKNKSEDESLHVQTTKEPADLEITTREIEEEISKTLFESTESTPEKSAGNAESSEEEKPVPKPTKKKSKEKRKPAPSVGVVEPLIPKEQGSRKNVVVEQNIIEEVLKTESEPAYENSPPLPIEEEILPKIELQVQAEPVAIPSKKSKKSKGTKEKNLSADGLNVGVLVEKLESSNLNNNDIQRLVDVLLDKQKTADQWKTTGSKPDPIDVLKKQLTEKESAFVEEHARADKLAIKTKEIRDELNQEKIKHKSNENSANQKMQTLEKENQALQMRMNASQNNHSQENQNLRASLEQCKKNHGQLDWRQLQEELAGNKESLLRTNSEKAALEARISSFENDLDSRSDNESIILKQIAEANDRLVSSDVVKKSLSQQLQESIKGKADSEHRLDMAKKELVSTQSVRTDAVKAVEVLQTQLDVEKSKKSELEKMFRALEVKQNDESGKHTKEKEVLLQKLKSASNNKSDETQLPDLQRHLSEVSKQLEELRAQLAHAEEEHRRSREALVAKEEQLGKHEGEINALKSSVSSKDAKIEGLKMQISINETEQVLMKTNVVEDLQAAAPDFDDGKVIELEEKLEKLQVIIDNQKETLEKYETASEGMKQKNNDLREKNWKAMDAISTAEKKQKSEIGKAVVSLKEENKKTHEQYFVDTKTYLCTIHPNISIDKDLSYEKFLKEYENKTKELGCGFPIDNTKSDELEEKLEETLKRTQDLDAQCEKYKVTLASTENMLHELEQNVEKEMESLKETVQNKDSDLQKLNSTLDQLKNNLQKSEEETKSKQTEITSLQKELKAKESDLNKITTSTDELNEKLKKTREECNSKDTTISSLQNELSNKEHSSTDASELEKLNSTLDELKKNLQKSEEETKSKQTEITSLQKELTNKESDLNKVNSSLGELKENAQKARDDSTSKDGAISSLQKELSTLKESAENASSTLKNELKKLNEDLERLKEQENSLRVELSKKETPQGDTSEVDKCKKEAEDAAKVNAELRKELEAVRMECGELKSSPKKKHKESDKIKNLEEKLVLASKKESELHVKIASMEDSKSMNSVDEEVPGSPDKKKKGKGFSLLGGSKSSKYETKYKEMTEKYEHAKTEIDEKSSKISQLESKLQQSELALKAQDDKVQELSDNLNKAHDNVVTNGGVQNTSSKPLNESQMKQLAEAMTDGEQPGV